MKKKIENLKPLAGNRRKRHRAKSILSCHHIAEGFWRVWGGEQEHIVKVSGKEYFCDCKNVMEKKISVCSHIVRVMIENGELPNK
jgi:hypothetical protein